MKHEDVMRHPLFYAAVKNYRYRPVVTYLSALERLLSLG
jgi:hypothetical protein